MPEPAKVVGIGSCGVDYFAIVPRLLGPEEKINADRLEIHAGGVTGNNLTQVGRLGISAAWLGLIGDDDSGRLITKAFADDGLDLSGIETIKGEQSTFVWIPSMRRASAASICFRISTASFRPSRCARFLLRTFPTRNIFIPKLRSCPCRP